MTLVELTFNARFAANLRATFAHKVILLPTDLQFGDLDRLDAKGAGFYRLKAECLALGAHQDDQQRFLPTARDLQVADAQGLLQLADAMAAHASLRVWKMATANDLVGFAWLCQRLQAYPEAVSQVQLPMRMVVTQPLPALIQNQNLGDVAPQRLTESAKNATSLPLAARQGYGEQWHTLVADPLAVRMQVNGQLITAPETCYDWALNGHLRPETFQRGRQLIAELVNRYPIDVPDWWWYYRIRAVLG